MMPSTAKAKKTDLQPTQHRSVEAPRERRVMLVSHGQGQVKNPDSDRRLKKNRDR